MSRMEIILLCLLYFGSQAFCQTIDIDLRNLKPNNGEQSTVVKNFNIATDFTDITIRNVDGDVGFLLIQVHSYLENVTLSKTAKMDLQSSVSGTNIGLVWAEDESISTFYLLREWKINLEVPILLVVSLYDELDPVPGGCNLSFDNAVAPYQKVSYTDEYVSVKSQPPSGYGVSCDDNKADIEMYHMFLEEHDGTNTTYFEGIKKMLTVNGIRQSGRKVHKDDGYFKYSRVFSNYRGTGSVYAIIATLGSRSAAYVPAVSYGCDVVDWKQSCVEPVTDHWKVLISIQFIFGLFVCFCGHRFFRLTLVIVGFTFGVVLTYCVVSLEDHSTLEATITSVAMGCFYGLFWAFIWWKFGVPLISTHISIILSGLLLASVVFYTGIADLDLFTNNWNYWLTFISIVLTSSIISLPIIMYGNIFACSFLGSYAFVTAANYYVGGNIQYIVINTYRRITTKNFNHAVIDPPFQFSGILHSVLWVFLLVTGITVQIMHQRHKPPFPPNRYPVILTDMSERTPLIRPQAVAPPDYV